MLRYALVPVMALFLADVTSRAADPSGPTAGDKVPPLTVQAVVGKIENKQVDYAAERKDKPTIYLFILSEGGRIPVGGRPAGRFMKELDKAVKQEAGDAYVVAVWLTDDKDKTKDYLPMIQQSLQLEATALTYHEGDKGGPKDWNINADCHVTAVVVSKQKVAASLGYKSLNETDVPDVVKALKKTDGK